jgi:large subunit ribosomal protein L6
MSTETSSPEAASGEVPLLPQTRVLVEGERLTVEGPRGRVTRTFPSSALALSVEGSRARLTLRLPLRRRSRALLRTWERHLGNLLKGVTVGFEARLKVVAAHFPMKVQARDSEILIENFLGEKHPRRAHLREGTRATVAGDELVLEGPDIEAVGQSAANLERATRIRDYDPRVFQDGIYITVKPHPKEVP